MHEELSNPASKVGKSAGVVDQYNATWNFLIRTRCLYQQPQIRSFVDACTDIKSRSVLPFLSDFAVGMSNHALHIRHGHTQAPVFLMA